MLRRDVFARVPGEGRWSHVLLADGNIGIGGDPLRLLERAAGLLAAGGTVLVETDPEAARHWRGSVRVRTAAGDGTVDPVGAGGRGRAAQARGAAGPRRGRRTARSAGLRRVAPVRSGGHAGDGSGDGERDLHPAALAVVDQGDPAALGGSIRPRAIDRPRPAPPCSAACGLRRRGSRRRTGTADRPRGRRRSRRRRAATPPRPVAPADRRTVPPAGVCRTALASTLRSTRVRSVSLPSTVGHLSGSLGHHRDARAAPSAATASEATSANASGSR